MNHHTFATFMIWDGNQRAYEVGHAVAELRPVRPSPVTFVGEWGSGKTHLLRAIAGRLRALSGGTAIASVSPLNFPEPVRKLAEDASPLRQGGPAILLIDELDRFNDEMQTLEGVVRAFLNAGHAVVIASNDHPARIIGLPKRLKEIIARGQLVPMRPNPAVPPEHLLQGTVNDRNNEVVRAQRAEIAALTSEIESLRQSHEQIPLDEFRQEAETLREELREARGQLAYERNARSELETKLQQAAQPPDAALASAARIEELEGTLEECRNELVEKEATLDRNSALLAEKEAVLEEKATSLSESEALIAQLRAELASKTVSVETAPVDPESGNGSHAPLPGLLNEANKLLDESNRHLERFDGFRKQQERNLELLTEIERELNRPDSLTESADAEQQIAVLQNELDEAHERIGELEIDRRRLIDQTSELRDTVTRLKQNHDASGAEESPGSDDAGHVPASEGIQNDELAQLSRELEDTTDFEEPATPGEAAQQHDRAGLRLLDDDYPDAGPDAQGTGADPRPSSKPQSLHHVEQLRRNIDILSDEDAKANQWDSRERGEHTA